MMTQSSSIIPISQLPYFDNRKVATVAFAPGMTLKEVEKAVILATLNQENSNRTRTAKVLGIGIRTLQRKLKQYQQEDE